MAGLGLLVRLITDLAFFFETLCMLGKNFSRQHYEILFYFSPRKQNLTTLCKLSPKETVCMKCQILFSGKNKKNIISLSSAEFARSMLSVNWLQVTCYC